MVHFFVDWQEYVVQCLDCECNLDLEGKPFKTILSLKAKIDATQKPVKVNCAKRLCPYEVSKLSLKPSEEYVDSEGRISRE